MEENPHQKAQTQLSDNANLPAARSNGASGSEDDAGGQHLYVNTLNYRANDLAELRKLAETSPELANKLLENQDRQNSRSERSYRLGLGMAGLITLAIVAGGSYVLVSLGWWQTVVFVLVLLGVSHVLRSVLKGEFSETSWFGNFLSGAKKKQGRSNSES